MFVKLPMLLNTLPNWSGCSHAAVNAQMPPDDPPQIARLAGSLRNVTFASFCASGSNSSRRNRA